MDRARVTSARCKLRCVLAPYRDGPAFHVHIRQMAHTNLVFPTPQVLAYFTNNGSEEEGASINDAVKSLCANGHHDQAVRY